MIFIIIGLIVGFVIGTRDEGFAFGLFCGLLGILIGIIAWFIVGGIIGCTLPMKEITNEKQLCALSDSNSISGEKFLFSGYINEKLECRYVVNTDRGKHIESVDADKMYIKEGNYKPKVVSHSDDFKSIGYYWFAVPWNSHEWYEFYVPNGTVTSEYSIDLK